MVVGLVMWTARISPLTNFGQAIGSAPLAAFVSSPTRGEVNPWRRVAPREVERVAPYLSLVGEDRKSPRAEGDWLDRLGEG
jgi:hypothetical protein